MADNNFQYQQPIEKKKVRLIVIVIFVALAVIFSWSSLTYTIDAGHAGLIFYTFGEGINPEEAPKGQGFHLKAPWNKVIDYEVRQQEISEHMEPLSSNLLKMQIDITLFYQPMYSELGRLEIERGQSYRERVIMPAIRSVTRDVIGRYLPEEINTTKRDEVKDEIEKDIREVLASNFIEVNEILIRNIKLPLLLEEAIERKLQQEQESLEYEFRIEKAQKEAQRKEIEAQGIQNFQRIVAQSITQDLLRWKGIEATELLAGSDNAKVIVIGGGEDGLPIILGNN
jgi:prohibitin 1